MYFLSIISGLPGAIGPEGPRGDTGTPGFGIQGDRGDDGIPGYVINHQFKLSWHAYNGAIIISKMEMNIDVYKYIAD